MTSKNQVFLLLVIGSIWAGVLAWQFMQPDESVHVPLAHVSGQATTTAAPRGKSSQGLRVNLELLAASRTERETTFSAPRNIFAPPQTSLSGPSDLAPQESADNRGAEEALRQQAISAELGQFRYLGYLQVGDTPRKRRPLALLMKNDDLHMVRSGETIEEHVLVKTITPDGITLQETDSRVEYTVPLAQEPVTP